MLSKHNVGASLNIAGCLLDHSCADQALKLSTKYLCDLVGLKCISALFVHQKKAFIKNLVQVNEFFYVFNAGKLILEDSKLENPKYTYPKCEVTRFMKYQLLKQRILKCEVNVYDQLFSIVKRSKNSEVEIKLE